MKIAIGILGISGSMGQALCNLISQDPALILIGGIRKKGHENLELSIKSLVDKSDIVIDFSSPDALQTLLKAATAYKKPLVIGTTGYSDDQLNEIKNSATKIPILLSSNFSLGIAICKMLTKIASEKGLGHFKIEISETHHSKKKDKPSGTALLLKEATKNDVKIRSFRIGEVIGKHKISFSSSEEKFEISHEALSRDAFAKGALASVKYIIHKPPKLYSIEDIFS